jgi:hypothetical protein
MATEGVIRMKGIAYWCNSSGLGNRLRALVGYQAMADILGLPYYLCWQGSWASDSTFEDLFCTTEIRLITPEEMGEITKDNNFRVFSDNPWIETIWNEELCHTVSWSQYVQQVYKCLAALTPRDELKNMVDDFCQSADFTAVSTGLHIRWTDNLRGFKYLKNFVPEHASTLRGFESAVESRRQRSELERVYLCTDNLKVERDFKRRFPDTILTYRKDYRQGFRWSVSLKSLKISRKNQRTSLISDALIEMLILARCPTIVGTHRSSFSVMSAMLGRRPFYIVRGEDIVEHEYMTGLLNMAE